MSTSLTGKTAIVTGSSRSIGAAIVKRLADDGANVVVNYFSSSSAADEVVTEINSKRAGAAVAVQADISSIAGAQKLLEESLRAFGKVDILVLNAGLMDSRVLADVDEECFDSHFNTNVKGPLFLMKAAAPSSGGRVIFFSSSLTGASTVLPNNIMYIASKGAIEQAARALVKDYGSRGITVNVVSPGPVDTPMFRNGKSEQVIDFITGLHPLKRIGNTDEISPIVSFLSSPAASWINGQNIRVNGGYMV